MTEEIAARLAEAFACNVPTASYLHPIANMALVRWIEGSITDYTLFWLATIVDSNNAGWASCLSGIPV